MINCRTVVRWSSEYPWATYGVTCIFITDLVFLSCSVKIPYLATHSFGEYTTTLVNKTFGQVKGHHNCSGPHK
jgi:hypothetical protein